SGVAIFDLDYDAIISAMYALSFSAEGDCYRCVPPDPGIAAAALGASASGTPPGTAPAEALHTFTLDSGASCYFFCDSTVLTPLPAHVPIRLADPSGGPVVARSSTVLPFPAVPSGSLLGLHLPSFSTSSLREPFGTDLPVLPEGIEPGGAESEGAESGGSAPRGAASSGGPAGASLRLSSQQLREWLVRRAHRQSGAPGAGGAGDTGAGGAAVTIGAGGTGGTAATGDGAGGSGVGGTGAGGTRAAGAGVVDPGAGGAGGTSQPPLQPASPLPTPSPYTEQSGGLTGRREPASRPVLPVRTARHASRSRPPPVPSTHAMALHPSSVPLRVPLPAPPESSLPEVPDPASDRARAASPTVSRLLETAVTDPSFESAAASALVAELLDFAAACRLDYASALVGESVSASPPSVGGECALGTNVLEDRQEEFECLAAAVPLTQRRLQRVDYFHTLSPTPKMTTLRVLLHVAAERDYELHSLDISTTFLQGSLHEEIWLRRPPGFTGTFPAGTQWRLRRLVYGLRQAPREWHDTLRNTLVALGFAPSPADPSLFLGTDTLLPPFYVLVYINDLVFATADTEALTLVTSELQKRHTCTDLGELRGYLGLQITRDRARRTITLTQSHMVHQVLQHFGFQFSSPQPTPLSTSHSLSAPPSDESVEPSGPYPELVGCLMYLMTCTRPDLAYPFSLLARYVAPGRHRKVHWDAAKRVLRYLYSTSGMGLVLGGRGPVVLTGHADASWVEDSATQRSSQGCTFSLGSGFVSWQSTRSSSVRSLSCEAEIYAGAMDAQELRWLTYLLTNLGEQPRSPPVLYVDNKAMIALCQEHRLEHRTKHIALRYFLARELQQRGQLRLAYVATRANTADVFTKALPPGDHQRFATVLGLLALLFLTGLVTTCSPPLCLWGGLIHRVVDAFLVWFPCKFKRDWVQFPPEELRAEMALDFRAIKGVPNVIGVIDGTHIHMKGMEAYRGDYFNRKSVYSVQLQVTYLHGRLESGEIAPYQLVGDAAYPLKSYMLTPLYAPRRPLMKKWEQTYNYVQSATRMVVERTIGALKGRWRLFGRRHERKLWRVCAGTACIIILHNMLQTV
ncbi:unnamed protein product, partial [Closterium sp. NIES-53]